MSATTQAERSAKSEAKRLEVCEEQLRLRVRPGTKQALAELMAWHGISEQGELMTLAIHHLHALGPKRSAPLLAIPPHEITISEKVGAQLDRAYARELLRICTE